MRQFFARKSVDQLTSEATQNTAGLKRVLGKWDLTALGIGVIDIKDNEVETPEFVAQRIETAVKALGEERIRWVHPDCGFWMLQRSVADRKLKALAEGRNLFLGKAKR